MTSWSRPQPYEPTRAEPMGPVAKEIADELKRVYRAYAHKGDERGRQTTIGPSELGTTCDRRLAMKLTGVQTAGESGDGWAPFIGTSLHAELANAFELDNEAGGNWKVELAVKTGHPLVPGGTADLYDIRRKTVIDHKITGDYLLNKIRHEGPGEDYRVQLHTYGYALTVMGFPVERVALAAWPKAQSNLRGLYVWVEDFDPDIVRTAFSRLSRIMMEVDSAPGFTPLARSMNVAADTTACRFCPYKSEDPKVGCPGDTGNSAASS